MEWTTALVLQFIKAYEKRELLWNNTHTAHKILNKKNEAWEEISKELNIEVSELKNKMSILLATYRKARNKTIETNVEPRWFAYKSFSFLHNRYQRRSTKNIEEGAYFMTEFIPEQKQEEIYEEDSKLFSDQLSLASGSNMLEDYPSTAPQQQQQQQSNRNAYASSMAIGSRKRCAEDEDSRVDESYGILQSLEKDEYDAYGEYIARKLRSMDKRTCAYVQKAFSDVIFDAEMGKYAEN
ncbi:uncharacterized protein [Periplaneta americana]|uniref:uncharacterized protein n=1 Tax=Periplaneta americana TaxID=6978 RepID=UPI0037E944AF